MARRITIDQLPGEVEKILSEYGDEVQKNLDSIVKEVTQKGAAAVRSSASGAVKGTGKYARGWRAKTEVGRLSTKGIIYNSRLPGLPHLLEYGHALRDGGRTNGSVHIAPVEEAVIKEFERKVVSKL